VTGDDPRLRFRVYVEGDVLDEQWLDASNPDSERQMDGLLSRHAEAVECAEAAGFRWQVEIYDPAKSDDIAYTRYGTDLDGMANPHRVKKWERIVSGDIPNPGSDEAILAGCVCPVVDNGHGQRADAFVVVMGCPVHWPEEPADG
jgi:hypothetical protein